MQPENLLSDPVVIVAMEAVRVRALLSEHFADAFAQTGLTRMEMAVLIAVRAAPSPPTVPQIGRSTGHARQVIQKAANGLFARGLLETSRNPHHKQAGLLHLTPAGRDVVDQVLGKGGAIADRLRESATFGEWSELAHALSTLRQALDEIRER
jgi:DNA-binding MarR family transcriptional regulator